MYKKKLKIYFILGNLLLLFILPTFFNQGEKILKTNTLYLKSSQAPPTMTTLRYGTSSGPADLDPADAWDSASYDVIRQTAETLFFNNLSDPDLPLVNWLAKNYTWVNSVTLEIDIRTDVYFHDGTLMDAAACMWNIDRLIHLMNHTGLTTESHVSKFHSLFEFINGTPIMNRTNAVDSNTFQIILNAPYSPFLNLLAYTPCSILSPTSTFFDQFLDKSTDDLVGTGPYMYDYYITNIVVHYTRWDNYWQEPPLYQELVFNIISDSTNRQNAMLALDIDYLGQPLASYHDMFIADPDITLHEHSNAMFTNFFLAMNNDVTTGDADPANGLNITWRKAISWAINYSYIVEEMQQDNVVRSYSWISPGFSDFFDSGLPAYSGTPPDDGDIVAARQIIKDDLGPVNADIAARDVNTASDWQVDSDVDPDRIVSFNYSYDLGNTFRENLLVALRDWLGQIGIWVIDGGTDRWYFINRAYGYIPGGYDELQLFPIGWGPDYIDPMNMIQPMISSTSPFNNLQVNDPWIDGNITSYYSDVTLSENEKKWIIWNITYRCSNELYTCAWLYHPKAYSVHNADLAKVPYNVLNNFWAYPIISDTYPIIESSGDDVFLEGDLGHEITWNLTANSLSTPWYSIYEGSTIIAGDTWTSGDSINVNLDGYSAGKYTFTIYVENGDHTIPDSVQIIVASHLAITQPADFNYTEGDTGNSISWTLTDGYEENLLYHIYRDNVLQDTDTCQIGVPISINVDGLAVGTYSYRINVDNQLEFIDDTVIVTVEVDDGDGLPPEISGFSVVLLALISVVTIYSTLKKLKKKV